MEAKDGDLIMAWNGSLIAFPSKEYQRIDSTSRALADVVKHYLLEQYIEEHKIAPG